MTAPLTRTIEEGVPAAATAAADDTVIGQAPFAATVTAVAYVPEAAITGANTNTRRVELVNKGAAGTGTTVVASLQFDAGTNATANNEVALALSGTAANLVLAEGDTLQWRSIVVGTGLADPGGIARVTMSRT